MDEMHLIMERLGAVATKIENLTSSMEQYRKSNESGNFRITMALIGIVAAQIGVKILGTPILLDIATTLGILGVFLLFGFIFYGFRLVQQKCKITRTGWSLVVMMFCIMLTQILVYFRDLGVLDPNVIYAFRILQNMAIIFFAWNVMLNHHIANDKIKDASADSGSVGLNKKSGAGEIKGECSGK